VSRSPILWALAGLAVGIVFVGGAVAGALGFAAFRDDRSGPNGPTPAGAAVAARGTTASGSMTTPAPSVTNGTPAPPSGSTPPTPTATPIRSTSTAEACDLGKVAPLVQQATVQVRTSRSVGSAFHIGKGEFITAAHVVEGETEVRLLSSHVTTTATVIGLDFPNDIAVLRAAVQLGELAWGESGGINTGRRLGVMGYPSGTSVVASFTVGVVSRNVVDSAGVRLIQTDAAINPGNSGGPMFDDCGRVVGVVASKRMDQEGVGFAVAEISARPAVARARMSPPKQVCSDRSAVVAAGAAGQIALELDQEQRLTGEFSVAQTDPGAQLGIRLALVDAAGATVEAHGMVSPGVQYMRGTFDIKSPPSVRYLVIDNRFSVFTPKSVTLTLCVFR